MFNMEKLKKYFTAYRLTTIALTLFTFLYWVAYMRTPEPQVSHILLIGIFILPLFALVQRFVSLDSNKGEFLTYAVMTNVFVIPLLILKKWKQKETSISNLFNVANSYLLLTVWFYQMGISFGFFNGLLYKGFLVSIIAGTLIIYFSDNETMLSDEELKEFASDDEEDDKENKEDKEDDFMKELQNSPLMNPKARDGHF